MADYLLQNGTSSYRLYNPGDPVPTGYTLFLGAEPTLAQMRALGYAPTQPRTLYAIYTDLQALTTTQQNNVWADLGSGAPPKYLLDAGANASALWVLDYLAREAGLTGAALTRAKFRAVAMYVQDNPAYLVRPAFDPTINVSGVEPA